MTRNIYLVRHGQTTWNVEGRLQGQGVGGVLTDLGWQQARIVAETLSNRVIKPVGALIISDAIRAQQTAEPISQVLGLEPILEPLLREQDFGDMEGKLHSELQAQPTPPGKHINEVRWGAGESIADLYLRWCRFVDKLPNYPAGDLVVISHGMLIRTAVCWADGGDFRDVVWKDCPNGSITEISID